MERLPSLLVSSIQHACEHYRNITFTIHGAEDKARISIVFCNDDQSKMKRKSNATVRRNTKRMNNYVDDQSKDNRSENELEETSLPNDRVITNEELREHNSVQMDTNSSSNHVETPGPVTRSELPSPVVDKMTHSDENVIRLDSSALFDRPRKTKQSSERPRSIIKNTCINDRFSKIVLKTGGLGRGTLVGITMKDNIVLYQLHELTLDRMEPGHRLYPRFNRVVTEDFRDVRETDFMSEEIERCFPKMLMYAVHNEL